MTLTMRKLIVAGSVVAVLLLANAALIADWLVRLGLVGLAQGLRQEYVTGTAITVIVVMLFVLTKPKAAHPAAPPFRRCPVCDHELRREGSYCPECGSRVRSGCSSRHPVRRS